MIQNLRCKTLTYFKFYKDVFLSRVMELPQCNSSHWKSKFIDDLPTLFAERVRKTLRGDSHKRRVEPYREKKRFYKSRQRINKTDTCHKCGRFGHYAKDCKVKEKIKNDDIDDNIKESLCKIMLNFDLGKS
ncbi:hypothetical protein H5410_060462 [Solanum commersonii]|uniref:CCHC-type domain-containing protein n=1 Tax=Solanum commersonii TaxID=4109 RepID=A0A9J5W641_SOLCO|nr:hypothetical protein H5410_060462 [Solanum commersonii]